VAWRIAVSAARDEVETIFACPRSDGFDSGCSFLAARLNQLGERWKLVEPTCERQRAGRVETVVTVVGVWLPGVSGGFDPGCSFFAARLDRLDVL